MRSEYKMVSLFYSLFSFHSLFILCYKKSFKRINFHLSKSKKKKHRIRIEGKKSWKNPTLSPTHFLLSMMKKVGLTKDE